MLGEAGDTSSAGQPSLGNGDMPGRMLTTGNPILVEYGNGACYSHNNERLAGDDGKNYGAEHGCEQHFVDAVLHIRLGEHV